MISRNSHYSFANRGIPVFFKLWFAFVALLALSIIGFVIFTLFNPELIGEFFGRIVSGFQGVGQ
jgi:uncharacterized membrane protein